MNYGSLHLFSANKFKKLWNFNINYSIKCWDFDIVSEDFLDNAKSVGIDVVFRFTIIVPAPMLECPSMFERPGDAEKELLSMNFLFANDGFASATAYEYELSELKSRIDSFLTSSPISLFLFAFESVSDSGLPELGAFRSDVSLYEDEVGEMLRI